MISGVDFSDRGDALTDFELRLLQTTADESTWVAIGQRLVAELGPAVAARAFGIVLDETGGAKMYIPQRRTLFASLWRGMRDELLLDLCGRPGWTVEEIAEELGLSERRVREIRARGGARDDIAERGVG